MNGCPIALTLQGGIVADYVAGSDPPSYTVDGERLAVDVVIPDDLAALGWFWLGTTLYWRDPDAPNHIVGVATCTYPPPGIESDRPDCFTVARGIDVRPVTQLAAKPAPARPAKTKKVKPAPQVLVQAAMEL